jgi:hypothetical protein
MHFDDVVANSDKTMPDHVLEVALDDERLVVQGFDEMITESNVT